MEIHTEDTYEAYDLSYDRIEYFIDNEIKSYRKEIFI